MVEVWPAALLVRVNWKPAQGNQKSPVLCHLMLHLHRGCTGTLGERRPFLAHVWLCSSQMFPIKP